MAHLFLDDAGTESMKSSRRFAPAVAVILMAAVFLSLTASALGNGSVSARRNTDPDVIVALGHSGVTGYNSDPRNPNSDATANSWITGTNPTVDSLYQRILARNPAIKGHNVNLGVDGSKVDDLVRQAREAVALSPAPQLVVIATVDNDIRCDGTDKQNYAPFQATLSTALGIIGKALPTARIFIVSSPWSTVRQYASAIVKKPGGRASQEGTGPCDLFDPSGKPVPSRWTYLQHVTDRYYAVLAASCRRFTNCRYDHGALAHLAVVPRDISPDLNHLSVQGQRKVAAVEWPLIR